MQKALPARSAATSFDFMIFPFPPRTRGLPGARHGGRAPPLTSIAPVLLEACQVERLERARQQLRVGANSVRGYDQSGALQIAAGTERALLGEFGGIGAD